MCNSVLASRATWRSAHFRTIPLFSPSLKNRIHQPQQSGFLQVQTFLEKSREDQRWQKKAVKFHKKSKRRRDLHLMFSSQETEGNWGMLLGDHSESRLVRKEKREKIMEPLWNRKKPVWVCTQPFGFTISYMFAWFQKYLHCKGHKLTAWLGFLLPMICFRLAAG